MAEKAKKPTLVQKAETVLKKVKPKYYAAAGGIVLGGALIAACVLGPSYIADKHLWQWRGEMDTVQTYTYAADIAVEGFGEKDTAIHADGAFDRETSSGSINLSVTKAGEEKTVSASIADAVAYTDSLSFYELFGEPIMDYIGVEYPDGYWTQALEDGLIRDTIKVDLRQMKLMDGQVLGRGIETAVEYWKMVYGEPYYYLQTLKAPRGIGSELSASWKTEDLLSTMDYYKEYLDINRESVYDAYYHIFKLLSVSCKGQVNELLAATWNKSEQTMKDLESGMEAPADGLIEDAESFRAWVEENEAEADFSFRREKDSWTIQMTVSGKDGQRLHASYTRTVAESVVAEALEGAENFNLQLGELISNLSAQAPEDIITTKGGEQPSGAKPQM